MSTRTDTRRAPRPDQRTTSGRLPKGYRVARWLGLLVVVALSLGIVVTVGLLSAEDRSPRPANGDVAAPANLTPSGSVAAGNGPVTVVLYFDYLCPACGAFESANGEELDRLIEGGAITMELRPMAFLDRLSSGTAYSTRAAKALATVADAAPDRVWAFHSALYAEQPAENGPGLTDDQIFTIAVEAGVPADVAARFTDDRFEPWVAAITERAFADGVQGTPTVLVDGELFDGDRYTAGPLTEAIERAARVR